MGSYENSARLLGPNGNPLWSLERVIKAQTMQIDKKTQHLCTVNPTPLCAALPGSHHLASVLLDASREALSCVSPTSPTPCGAGGAPGGSSAETPALLSKGGSVPIRMWCPITRLLPEPVSLVPPVEAAEYCKTTDKHRREQGRGLKNQRGKGRRGLSTDKCFFGIIQMHFPDTLACFVRW